MKPLPALLLFAISVALVAVVKAEPQPVAAPVAIPEILGDYPHGIDRAN